jgi:hypothetical protein
VVNCQSFQLRLGEEMLASEAPEPPSERRGLWIALYAGK